MKRINGKEEQNRIIHKLFLKSEVSWAFSDISKSIGPMVDLFFVSAFIGVNGVTVLGFVAPLFLFIELVGTMIANGARNKVSSMIGAGKLEESNRVFSDSLILTAGLTIVIGLIVGIFSSGLATLLGARDPEIAQMTSRYIIGFLFGYPFATLTRVLTPYLQIEGQYKRVNATALSTTIIDIVGDAIVVFVLKGGMLEIGLATAIGNIIPFFIGASYYMGKNKSASFSLKLKGFSPKLCLEMLKLGAPNGVTKGSCAIGGIVINNMLASLNMPYLVAATGVFNQIQNFLRASYLAPADTLLAFVPVFIGEEDKDSIKLSQKIAIVHSLIMTSIVAILLFFGNGIVANLFLKTDDPEAFRLASECIRICCFSIPLCTFFDNFNNYLMAVKKIRAANIFGFLCDFGVMVPVTYIMINLVGYRGAWIAKVLNLVIITLLIIIYILLNKEGDKFSDKMLLLPRDFGVTADDEISVVATTTKEIMHLSQIAILFAVEHEADEERARFYGLVTEELSIFLSEHGFKDGKPHSINARLVAKDEDLIIRMRDDCKLLNLREYYQMLSDNSGDTNGGVAKEALGLPIIFKASKEVQYTPTFGANNLIIRM